MNMRLEIGRLCQLKHVGVECGHLWTDIVKQVRLLHVTSIDSHWDLLVELLDRQAHLDEPSLSNSHLNIAVVLLESVQGSQRKSVSF